MQVLDNNIDGDLSALCYAAKNYDLRMGRQTEVVFLSREGVASGFGIVPAPSDPIFHSRVSMSPRLLVYQACENSIRMGQVLNEPDDLCKRDQESKVSRLLSPSIRMNMTE